MVSSALLTLVIKYSTEVVAGGIILAVRWLEKKSLIKKMNKARSEINKEK